MGRIKSTLIKRTAKKLIERSPDSFNEDFKHNENALKDTMPSKSIRNKIAGYIARLIRMQSKEKTKTATLAATAE